jgi:preprotein translocase subunit Sss1
MTHTLINFQVVAHRPTVYRHLSLSILRPTTTIMSTLKELKEEIDTKKEFIQFSLVEHERILERKRKPTTSFLKRNAVTMLTHIFCILHVVAT